MNPIQAAIDRIPQVPRKGRNITTVEKSDHSTRSTPRLSPIILSSSITRAPPTPNRTKSVSLPHIGTTPKSLYSHSNHSNRLLSPTRPLTLQSRSNPAKSLFLPSLPDLQKTVLQIQRRWPSISLLRSRRKLWKKYWIVVDLPTIPESNENDSLYQSSRPTAAIYRKPPPLELSLTPTRIKFPSPTPELDEDSGSEPDDELDGYEFDLSCCSPSYAEHSLKSSTQPLRIHDKREDSQYSNAPVRVVNHMEADISSIFESISRRPQ